MRLQLDDTHTRSLVRWFRARDYSAVRRARGRVDVFPLIAWNESVDERRVRRLLEEWRLTNPHVEVELSATISASLNV